MELELIDPIVNSVISGAAIESEGILNSQEKRQRDLFKVHHVSKHEIKNKNL